MHAGRHKLDRFCASSRVTGRALVTERLKAYTTRKHVHILLGGKRTGELLRPGRQSDCRTCLDEEGLQNLVKFLHDLSRQGYAKVSLALPDHAAIIRILVHAGVARRVQRSHVLHKDWHRRFGPRGGCHQILVPSCASLPVVIGDCGPYGTATSWHSPHVASSAPSGRGGEEGRATWIGMIGATETCWGMT